MNQETKGINYLSVLPLTMFNTPQTTRKYNREHLCRRYPLEIHYLSLVYSNLTQFGNILVPFAAIVPSQQL